MDPIFRGRHMDEAATPTDLLLALSLTIAPWIVIAAAIALFI
jgi:hypothetical protein